MKNMTWKKENTSCVKQTANNVAFFLQQNIVPQNRAFFTELFKFVYKYKTDYKEVVLLKIIMSSELTFEYGVVKR